MNAVNKFIRRESDNPTIGLLICKDMDRTEVQLAFQGITTPMGVATYDNVKIQEIQEYLPTAEQIQQQIKIAEEEYKLNMQKKDSHEDANLELLVYDAGVKTIYDDRLEITSPGGLMPGVTIDGMKEGYSQIRNRALAHAFFYMNLIEGWGTGIPRLLREMKEYGLPEPEFVDMEIALRVNLYRVADTVQSSAELVRESALKVHENEKVRSKCAQSAFKRDLTAQEVQIMDYIIVNGSITSAQLMEFLNIKKRRAQVILGRMAEDGLIRKKGASRNTHYVLME